MKITNFFTVLLLATAITTASSRTVTDCAVQSKLHGQELTTKQLLISRRDNTNPTSLVGNKQLVVVAEPDPVAVDFGEAIDEISRLQQEDLCMSKELCIRKEVICVKKCRSGADAEVGLHHFPRCQVICRKCVPNC